MFTYTGEWVTGAEGTPSILAIAVQLGRIARFTGATRRFYPVLLHSFVVADLLPSELEVYGLLHDAAEICISDVPKPFKPPALRDMERKILARIHGAFSMPVLDETSSTQLRDADRRALIAEAHVIGPPGLQSHPDFQDRCAEADGYVAHYLECYGALDCIHEDGRAVRDFLVRFRYARLRSVPTIST